MHHKATFSAKLILAALLGLTAAAAAQQQPQGPPRIGYVFPAGGKQGTTFEARLGGQFLDGVDGIRLSATGVKATITEYIKPINQGQAAKLRNELMDLQEKKQAAARPATKPATKPVFTPEDEKRIAEIRQKLLEFRNRPMTPAIAGTVTVQFTIAPDAEPGERELRLLTASGLTNPIIFCVGQLPEFRQSQSRGTAGPTELSVVIPAVINGQTMPGDVDRIRFKATKGQKLVIAAKARELIPYLPDAVPGWFQATLALSDGKGRELASANGYRFHPDPLLLYEVPKDGEYIVEIKDSIYRGREDFVYRLTIAETPFITSIFPLGGKAGALTNVEVKGWNLPAATLAVDARDRLQSIIPLVMRKDQLASNRVPFAIDMLPEALEQEPNNSPERAQQVTLPIIINGRIDQPGDVDVFRFEGRAGEQIVAEVYARRLDSPLDSCLKLTDASGKQIAFNDDHEDKAYGLLTHHADSYIKTILPAAGTYYVHISDAQQQGGNDYAYRLRISAARPDFELRIAPSAIDVRPGGTVPTTVSALRRDGFSGEIALALKGAPAGFMLSGARIPAGQDQVRLTLTAPIMPLAEPVALAVEGRATFDNRDLVRMAQPADDMMQAFAYHHLVVAKELLAFSAARRTPRTEVRLATKAPARLAPGGTAAVQLVLPQGILGGQLHFELSDPPEGITIKSQLIVRGSAEIVLQAEAAKTKVGMKGNLIVNIFAERPATGPNAKAAPNRPRAAIGTVPAIAFEIGPR